MPYTVLARLTAWFTHAFTLDMSDLQVEEVHGLHGPGVSFMKVVSNTLYFFKWLWLVVAEVLSPHPTWCCDL